MDKRWYLRVIQVGTARELLSLLREETGCYVTFQDIDHKIDTREATKFRESSGKKPAFKFTPKFFTKLNLMPAVTIQVMESRRHIRKTCYGFREKRTGERVYLRIDPGSVVEFRDGLSGYLIGTRYLIPNLDRMRQPRWDKVNRLMTRLLSQKGIIVTAAMVAKWRRSSNARVKLSNKVVGKRLDYKKYRIWYATAKVRRANEKANKQISERSGVVRDSDSG